MKGMLLVLMDTHVMLNLLQDSEGNAIHLQHALSLWHETGSQTLQCTCKPRLRLG